MHKKRGIEMYLLSFLFSATFLSATSLIFPSVFADSVVDVITINVSSSCTLSATGTGSHTATVGNGQTVSDIGTTNLNVICNDNSGYAIYAIGYTDDVYGKTVLTNPALGSTNDIITASSVTAGTSSWAMKLASTAGTYTPTIVSDYASYHAVPEEYTKVAYYTASTDAGTNAIGSSLSTTYRAYVSPNQPAGTYVGQVKYTLVHPNGDFPIPEDSLVGTTLRFNEHIDVESLSSVVGNEYSNVDLDFVIKVTPDDVCNIYGIQNSGITTWSQLLESVPLFLEALGATNIQSDMQIINEDHSFAYADYLGFYYFNYHAGMNEGPEYWFYYDTVGDGEDTSNWLYLPASTGSMSFILDNQQYNFGSFREFIGVFANGAWLGEQYYGDHWQADLFRTIYIYGGDDVTDPALIQWLNDNATLLYIEDSPSSKTWTFNEHAPSDPAMRWDVEGSVYSNQYTAYHFDNIHTSTDYGVPIWSFYYYDTTAPYEAWDGFIYLPEDLNIPESGIDYTAGWYFGNGQRPAQYVQVSPPTITLQGGEDLYNPAFISWLRENATSN